MSLRKQDNNNESGASYNAPGARYNFRGLQNDSTWFLYKLRSSAKVAAVRESSANDMYGNLKKVDRHSIDGGPECRKIRKETQEAVSKAKNEAWLNVGDDIECCIGNTHANKAWRILRNMRKEKNDDAGGVVASPEWIDSIRQRLRINKTILDTIETKQLAWYGHIQRMNLERWPKRV
nr:unnamed protein product [Callosobruchus analis]